jgi:methionyl-tRNA formyltransferase
MVLPAPILFFGMHGPFSAAPLAALLDSGAEIAAVVIPAPRQQKAEIERVAPRPAPPQPYHAVHLAWEAQLPVLTLREPGASAVEQLAALEPAVACVACWSQRIPPVLLAAPRHGFLNLHPSLLPAYRGPHPLFWALRDGLRESGVTVHWMDEELDRGDIALQQRLPFPEGVGPAVLEQVAGELAGELLLDVLRQLACGTAVRQPQPPGGSYQPAPRAADFTLDLAWPAQRAFNFMRGTSDWGQLYPLRMSGETLYLRQALGYDTAARLPAPVVRAGTQLGVQFTPGVLLAET